MPLAQIRPQLTPFLSHAALPAGLAPAVLNTEVLAFIGQLHMRFEPERAIGR
jgi:hypothetical protein